MSRFGIYKPEESGPSYLRKFKAIFIVKCIYLLNENKKIIDKMCKNYALTRMIL